MRGFAGLIVLLLLGCLCCCPAVPQAALLAGRTNKALVGREEFSAAVLRSVAGIEKKRSILQGMEKEVVARHEVRGAEQQQQQQKQLGGTCTCAFSWACGAVGATRGAAQQQQQLGGSTCASVFRGACNALFVGVLGKQLVLSWGWFLKQNVRFSC